MFASVEKESNGIGGFQIYFHARCDIFVDKKVQGLDHGSWIMEGQKKHILRRSLDAIFITFSTFRQINGAIC